MLLFAYLKNSNSIILSKHQLVNIYKMLSEPQTGSVWNSLASVHGIRLESDWHLFGTDSSYLKVNLSVVLFVFPVIQLNLEQRNKGPKNWGTCKLSRDLKSLKNSGSKLYEADSAYSVQNSDYSQAKDVHTELLIVLSPWTVSVECGFNDLY